MGSASRSRLDRSADPVDGIAAQVFVLPESQNCPAQVLKSNFGVTISRCVASCFFCPEASIGFRRYIVLRTAMPEAAVHEDCDFLPWEDNIGTPPSVEWEWHVDSETQACCVEGSAKGHLWGRVPSPVRLHICPHGW